MIDLIVLFEFVVVLCVLQCRQCDFKEGCGYGIKLFWFFAYFVVTMVWCNFDDGFDCGWWNLLWLFYFGGKIYKFGDGMVAVIVVPLVVCTVQEATR